MALVEKHCMVRVLDSSASSIWDWEGSSGLLAREFSEEELVGEPLLPDEADLRQHRNKIVELGPGNCQRACQVVAKSSAEVYMARPWRRMQRRINHNA